MGVSTNLGTKVNRRKRAVRLDPNIMKNISTEWGDEGDGVIVEVDDARKGTEEALFNELLLRYPEFLAAVVDNGVLMRVAVDGEGTGWSSKEVGEEVD